MKRSIILIVIGILLLAVDIRVPIGEAYPVMETNADLGEVFQTKVIDNLIGTRPTADVISDFLGYIIIFIGSMFLVREDKKFIYAMLLTPIAIYLYLTIPQLPYHFIQKDLYLKAAGNHFLIVFVEILIEYFVIHGIVTITNCMQNRWHNNELLVGWMIAMMSKGLLVGIKFFFGQNAFYYIYSLVMIAATIFYINRLYITVKFKMEEHT